MHNSLAFSVTDDRLRRALFLLQGSLFESVRSCFIVLDYDRSCSIMYSIIVLDYDRLCTRLWSIMIGHARFMPDVSCQQESLWVIQDDYSIGIGNNGNVGNFIRKLPSLKTVKADSRVHTEPTDEVEEKKIMDSREVRTRVLLHLKGFRKPSTQYCHFYWPHPFGRNDFPRRIFIRSLISLSNLSPIRQIAIHINMRPPEQILDDSPSTNGSDIDNLTIII